MKKYVIINPQKDTDNIRLICSELKEGSYLTTLQEAHAWIDKNDPEKKYAWDIYEVELTCVESL